MVPSSSTGDSRSEQGSAAPPVQQDPAAPGQNTASPSSISRASHHQSTLSASRKRRLELQAEEQRLAIKRRAIAEREKLDLDLVDRRLAFELAKGSEPGASAFGPPQGRGNASIRDWLETAECEGAADIATQGHQRDSAMAKESRCTNDQGGVAVMTPPVTFVNRLTNKNLPHYEGEVREWLRFKHAFELSTRLGKYTDEENIGHLHDCLRGKAREAVSSLLITATSSRRIMEVLETRFGNPNIIINDIVNEIKTLPRLGSGKIDLAVLATKVQNGVAAMQALQDVGYLHSPELCDEVLSKLPASMMPFVYRSLSAAPKGEPRLVFIAKFLEEEAEMACKTGTSSLRPSLPWRRERKEATERSERRRGPRNEAAILTISKAEAPWDVTSVAFAKDMCAFCRRSRHSPSKCEKFLETPILERWDWARTAKVCFNCIIKGHRATKCRKGRCDIDQCGKRHHYMLHNQNQQASKTGLPSVSRTSERQES